MKKETLNKVFRAAMISVPLVAFGGWQVIQNETAIYSAFDRVDGSNALCDIDPWCRDLTDNEIKLAKTSFGEEIDYGIVHVFSRPSLSVLFSGEISGEKPRDLYALYSNIYLHNPSIRSDDLTRDIGVSVLYQHEMTHVWQFQTNGDAFLLGAVEKGNEIGMNRYEYDISAVINFKDYGLEQQAKIIENIQALRLEAHFNIADRKKVCAELKAHEDKAKQMLPIRPSKACTNLNLTM